MQFPNTSWWLLSLSLSLSFLLVSVNADDSDNDSAMIDTTVHFCDMCGDASATPANPNLVVPFLAISENDNPTCQQLYDYALKSLTPSSDTCALVKSHKDFCGCPGASTKPLNECSLCPNGGEPENLNAVTPFEDTCSQLNTYLKYIPKDVCGSERVGSIQRADAFCGCPGVQAECYMCEGKHNRLSNPERKVPFYEFLGDSFSSTCQDLADFYTLYDTGDAELTTCEFVQMEAGYCGCKSVDAGADAGAGADDSDNQDASANPPVNACTLCTSGTSSNPDKYVDELEMTCGELETYLSYVPADQCSMPWVVDFSRFDYYCGCSDTTAPCPICPDGSINISNPDAIIPYLIIPNNDNPTCKQLATLGVIAEPGELVLDDCTIFEAQSDFCGCPNATKPEQSESCTFCPDGSDPPKTDLVTPFGDTCGELSEYLSYLPSDQCNTDRIGFMQRQDFLCGCATATTGCTLCKDHGSNDANNANRHIPLLSLPTNSNPTCKEVFEFMAVNDGDLSESGCAALQEYQGYCGCPEVTAPNECTFCPNGGTVGNATKIVSDLYTCQDLQDFVSFLPGDECLANSTDFTQLRAFAYACGCPDTKPSCTLCPDGSDPPIPNKLTGDRDGSTCADFAGFVETLTESQCGTETEFIASTASVCGCPGAETDTGTNTDDDGATLVGEEDIDATNANELCEYQQNADMCTDALLDSVPSDFLCECYAFCDSTFVKCQNMDGGIFAPGECSGTPITGCNRAGVYKPTTSTGNPDNLQDDDGYIAKNNSNKYGNSNNSSSSNNNNVTTIVAIVVPVVLALLVMVYYFYTRTPYRRDTKVESAADNDMDLDLDEMVPVRAMEGSLSMSDVPVSSPTSVASPPPESFSIGEEDDDHDDDDVLLPGEEAAAAATDNERQIV